MTAEPVRWIRVAQLATTRLAGRPRSARHEVFNSVAAESGVGTTYVRRAAAALEFVQSEANSYGLTLDQVEASVSVIELLKRMAKASPVYSVI